MQDVLGLIQDVVNSADDSSALKSAIEALANHLKQKKYVADAGVTCPHCGGVMKVVDDPVFGAGIIWRECQCWNCNRIVDDEYHLVGFSDVDPWKVSTPI